MSDTLFLTLFAIILLLILAVRVWRTARPSSNSKTGKNQPIAPSPVFLHAHSTNPNLTSQYVNTPAIPTTATRPRQTHRSGNHPRVVRGSDYLQNSRWSHLPSFAVGREGEDKVARYIEERLDGRWTMFRNLDLPDKKGDVDIALVGPGGIFALEVKTYTGSFRVENGRYYKKTRMGHTARMQRGPGAQARTNAIRLCNHLKDNGIIRGNSVTPVVVLSQDTSIEVISAATEIWTPEDITSRLTHLRSRKRLSQNQVDKIVSVLESEHYSTAHTVH
jgi:hypothetical protein